MNSGAKVIEDYILKGMIAEDRDLNNSIYRILYLINVVACKNQNKKICGYAAASKSKFCCIPAFEAT